MKTLVTVHGTFGRAAGWHLPGSLLRDMAASRGIAVRDFLWSGVLAGLPTALPGDPAERENGADDGALLPWLDAGEKLDLDLWGLTPANRPLHVLSHSHGLQVVTFAALRGVEFETAISVSGPIRRDMLRARRAAAHNIRKWVQFADPTGTDRTIIEGELHDGGGLQAVFDLPEGTTIHTPDMGHSGALTDHYWLTQMLDAL
jgi:hypothetical protein